MLRRALFLSLLLLPVLACNRSVEQPAQIRGPVAIEAGDECAVCGMIILNYPGPKGQIYLAGSQEPAKFCSTVDLFIYALQPEYEERIAEAYVHDMAATDWQRPDDSSFIPAKEAWFVAGHDKSGAMGPTLASFREEAAAQAFIAENGGHLLRYADVTLEVLQELSRSGHDHHDHGGHDHDEQHGDDEQHDHDHDSAGQGEHGAAAMHAHQH